MDITVNLSGAVFDYRYDSAVREFIDAAKADVAEVGINMMAASSAAFRYEASAPTGNWLRGLRITGGAGTDLIIEDPVV